MTFSQHKSSQPFGGEEHQPLGPSVAQSPLKRRSPASLSVRLRPNPSKRLKTSLTNREGSGLKAMQAQSLFPECSSTARIKSSKLPSPMKRSKSAEQWYHDTNENLNNSRDADAFPDGNQPPPPARVLLKISSSTFLQMIHHSICIGPHRTWAAPAQYRRISH